MGYAYVMVVEEDLTKLGLPEPSEEELVSAWLDQGGQGDPPDALLSHIRHALLRAWLETHREERLGELDEVMRWASGNLSWRPLLEDQTLNEILAESQSLGLYREFYSERVDSWFDSCRAKELVHAAQIHSRYVELDEYVRKELAAFAKALEVLVRYGLQFRFDFIP